MVGQGAGADAWEGRSHTAALHDDNHGGAAVNDPGAAHCSPVCGRLVYATLEQRSNLAFTGFNLGLYLFGIVFFIGAGSLLVGASCRNTSEARSAHGIRSDHSDQLIPSNQLSTRRRRTNRAPA